MIELKKINKSFSVNKQIFHALQHINLTVGKGEIFGIFGESGAGKSTLLRCVNLLEKPSSGQVWVDGIELTSLDEKSLNHQRKKIGMIFQHFNLLSSRTAFDNVALPLELAGHEKSFIENEVSRLLQLVHLEDKRDHFPSQLSGGQKQRVAIARALATKPSVLLCDEPTSALDTKSTAAILELLKDINQQLGVTLLIITHELEVIKQICDRAGVLQHGKLVEYGTVLQLFSQPKSVVTQQLVQRSQYLTLPPFITNTLQVEADSQKTRVVKFTFVGNDSTQPLISNLVKTFGITVNILQANIETIQKATVGFTVCQLSGDTNSIDQALASLHSTSITAEILGYA